MGVGVPINHAIVFLTSPLSVSLALIAVGGAILWKTAGAARRGRGVGVTLAVVGVTWLWFMSSGLANVWLGLSLERQFPPQRVGEAPKADAIVVLGGGVGGNTNTVFYTECFAAADRVVHAARLWKAGKAPVVIPSGHNEREASLPLLLEFGVPASAIAVENVSGNTEENARFVADVVRRRSAAGAAPRVLLVTSSWHMRRALLMFRKYAPGIEIVPAACDYETTLHADDVRFSELFLPNADALQRNSYMLKEYIGYWGYRLLRK